MVLTETVVWIIHRSQIRELLAANLIPGCIGFDSSTSLPALVKQSIVSSPSRERWIASQGLAMTMWGFQGSKPMQIGTSKNDFNIPSVRIRTRDGEPKAGGAGFIMRRNRGLRRIKKANKGPFPFWWAIIPVMVIFRGFSRNFTISNGALTFLIFVLSILFLYFIFKSLAKRFGEIKRRNKLE